MLLALRTNPRWWLAAGAVAGVATWNRLLVPLVWFGVLLGLAVLGPRAPLRTRWPWLGATVAAVVGAPNLVYQWQHDWPQLAMGPGPVGEQRRRGAGRPAADPAHRDRATPGRGLAGRRVGGVATASGPVAAGSGGGAAGLHRGQRRAAALPAGDARRAVRGGVPTAVAVGRRPRLAPGGGGRADRAQRRGVHRDRAAGGARDARSAPRRCPTSAASWPTRWGGRGTCGRSRTWRRRRTTRPRSSSPRTTGRPGQWRGTGRRSGYRRRTAARTTWAPGPGRPRAPARWCSSGGSSRRCPTSSPPARSQPGSTTVPGVDNEEQGAPVAICRDPVQPWAQLWPRLAHLD